MSILIVGNSMPEYCCRCPCHNDEYDICNLDKYLLIGYEALMEKKPNKCPLVEVPEHGDLIDRDDLLKYIKRKLKGKSYEEAVSFMYTTLKAYPVVIEADSP